MSPNKGSGEDNVRIIIRAMIPEVESSQASVIYKAVQDAVKSYPGYEVELSILPVVK